MNSLDGSKDLQVTATDLGTVLSKGIIWQKRKNAGYPAADLKQKYSYDKDT